MSEIWRSSNYKSNKYSKNEIFFSSGNICFAYTQRRIGVESIDNLADIKPIELAAYFSVNKTIEKKKLKCNPYQADLDKEKAIGQSNKDIEAKCNALNYLISIYVLLLMFISNMALWLSVSQWILQLF